ncbi:hypothetical protein M758_6G171000 [Ceratodon purpureus]|uniref:Uncharacterized protein n=1 Tax=Ceratodon purpureus TaxID=3225 RepID=A0A8T0HHH6_CERPU|nr:hypothetical protein KC19_6G178100 [Ceratodon purpureus]KAG0614363.1 hypothetical protein M758_6G171000 [Ceratodon purpureus]
MHLLLPRIVSLQTHHHLRITDTCELKIRLHPKPLHHDEKILIPILAHKNPLSLSQLQSYQKHQNHQNPHSSLLTQIPTNTPDDPNPQNNPKNTIKSKILKPSLRIPK